MTTIIQHEQDVFAPLAGLQDAIAEIDRVPMQSDLKTCADAGLKHHREAARLRLHRLRAIDSLRRPRSGISG